MSKLKMTFAFSIFVLFQNCKNSSNQHDNKQTDEIIANVEQRKNDEIDVDNIIDIYAKQLSNSGIKIVDSITCGQTENNIKKYEKGIRTYGYYSIKSNSLNGKLAGDLNGDNQTDYIANYSCENCYDGNGSENYLSNCFFLTSKDNQITVNKEMTNDFKQKIINSIKDNFGDPYFNKAEKEIMINGIEFTEIKNQIAYGTFNINTEACEGSPFPCIEGTFEYNSKNKTFKMVGEKINEQ